MSALTAGDAVADFEPHRRVLQGLAYRMLGSWSEAEDMVQEAWLRWRDVDRAQVDAPRAYLSRTVTRLCLDYIKSARARREEYVGPWLPEPLPDAGLYGGLGEGALAHDLSVALMLALERLSAPERAAFLLHDVFDQPYSEVARTLGRNEASCRQLALRARERVREARPRFAATEQDGLRIAEAFLQASREGDLGALRQLLADDAVLHSDGGGKKAATLRPVMGGDKVARFFAGIAGKPGGKLLGAAVVRLNGMPAVLGTEADGLPRSISLDIQDGRIVAVYMVRNPDKLRHVAALAPRQSTEPDAPLSPERYDLNLPALDLRAAPARHARGRCR